MSGAEALALTMIAAFIVLVFTGFPIAWILGGLAAVFTALASGRRAVFLQRFVATGIGGLLELGVRCLTSARIDALGFCQLCNITHGPCPECFR